MIKTDKPNLPKTAYDSEYMTEWGKEVKFLKEHGIWYTFVKRTPDYHIRQYKYKKTSELFAALYAFYTQIENERSMAEAERMMEGNAIDLSDETKELLEKMLHIEQDGSLIDGVGEIE